MSLRKCHRNPETGCDETRQAAAKPGEKKNVAVTCQPGLQLKMTDEALFEPINPDGSATELHELREHLVAKA